MTDKLKDPASSLPPAEDGGKKIAIGKAVKGKQVVINPPEKVDTNQGGIRERFQQALKKHTVILEKKTELVLQSKAARADLPEEALKQVFIRGYKNLPLNTELTREQYAMNRVNSFIAGGAALQEDCDLIPIVERMGMKGTGGAMRPHIKAERNVYNGRMEYHVVNAKGQVKHTATDKFTAKKHLAQKYNSYLNEDIEQIDELSKSTLGSYVKGAARDIGASRKLGADFENKADKSRNPSTQAANFNLSKKFNAIAKKRQSGIGKAVERLTKEEVEQIDEISTDGYHKAAVKSRMDAAVKVASSMGADKQAKTKLDARNKGLKRLSARTSAEIKKANSGPQKPVQHAPSSMSSPQAYYASKKPGEYTGDSFIPQGQMLEAKSAAARFQMALQNAKKKREEEEARREANEKRALAPREPQEKK